MRIGIFDSGVGGLTVVKPLLNIGCELLYFGDLARTPYGSKSPYLIERFSLQIGRFLKSHACELIIIACNTASAISLDLLKREFEIPIIDVISPGVELAVDITKNLRIGVIGTKVTIASGAYQRLLYQRNPKIEVFTKACPLLVPLVEEGITEGELAYKIVSYYLEEFMHNGMDTLILGCTHYPLLRDVIHGVLKGRVNLVDSATAIWRLLKDKPDFKKEAPSTLWCFVTEEAEYFNQVAKLFLKESPKGITKVSLSYLERLA